MNRPFSERLGWQADDLTQKSLAEWVVDDDRGRLEDVLSAGQGRVRARHVAQNGGRPVAMDWSVRTEPHGVVVLGAPADDGAGPPAVEEDAIRSGYTESELQSETLTETLRAMALIIEGQNPGRFCSILLVDQEKKRVSVGAGPSLSEEYNAAVEGLAIGPTVGSCGTAAYWGQRVLVENIQEEGLWRNLKQYAARAGVAACWSQPIKARDGEVIGALALYNTVPSSPSAMELNSLEMAAKMVAVAIERGRAEQTLRESEARAQFQARLLTAVTDVTTSFVDKNDWRTAAGRLVRAAVDLTESESGLLALVEASDFAALTDSEVIGGPYRKAFHEGDLDFEAFAPFLDSISQGSDPVVRNGLALRRTADSGAAQLNHLLGTPIQVNGDVIAILCVGNRPTEYTERQIDALSVLCRASSELFDAYRRQRREASLEDHLRQAAKMEAIGVLAGGVAHDFNNMLTVVQGNAELALEGLPEQDRSRRMLSRIVEAGKKSKELCNQMLAYAGRGARSVQPIELNSLMHELGSLQRATLSKKAQLEYDLSPESVRVQADPAQMNQVVMNLITNAAEAIGDDEGRIVVTTSAKNYGRRELELLQGGADLEPGRFVRLSVRDTGCGMDEETQERIFDPFFTTKAAGRGLGLAAVRGIVRAHQGAIQLESEAAKGTTFAVLLPQLSSAAPDSEAAPSVRRPQQASGKVVLVVDDEPAVMEIQAEILAEAGYNVLCASDGKEAVGIYEQKGDLIDCVLVDLSMPRLNGEETLHELRKLKDDVRVVLTSGFTEQEMLDRSRANGFNAVVQKPCPRSVLLETIGGVLA